MLPLLAFLLGGLPLLFTASQAAAASCSSPAHSGASSLIVHAPTLGLATVTWALAQRSSPLSAADARFLVEASQRSNIDDAFALAVWAAETQDGREAVPGTNNIGNITADHGVPWANHVFAVYPGWQAGIAAWFRLITQLYVPGGHARDLVTFALFYVHGLTPQQASPAMRDEVAQGYAKTLNSILTTLKQHESALQTTQPGTGSGNESHSASQQTLLSLLPSSDALPPGWAGPGTWPAASSIKLPSCDASVTALSPLMQAGLQLGVFLRSPTPNGLFDHWAANAPIGVRSQDGIVGESDFLASVLYAGTGYQLPASTPAASWWEAPPGQDLGWVRVTAGSGLFPQAGDIAILLDRAQGKMALIIGVQLPAPGHPGFVLVLQGQAQHVLERWALQADGTLQSAGTGQTTLAGYLRLPPPDDSGTA